MILKAKKVSGNWLEGRNWTQDISYLGVSCSWKLDAKMAWAVTP